MPRDLQAELTRRRAETDAYFANRPAQIASNINQSRSDITGARDQFFSNTLSPYLDQFGSAGTAAASMYKSRLGNELNRTLADRSRRENFGRVDLAYQNATRRAQESGMNLQSATDYARQFASDEQRRQFEAQQGALDRQAMLRKSNIADQYAQAGLGMTSASTGVDYESALIRALFGLGASVGTGYVLNKNQPQTNPYTPAPVSSTVPYGPQNQSQGMYPYNPYSSGGQ